MTWVCEYCDKEFKEYFDICRHLRICKERQFELKNHFSKADKEDYGLCCKCKYCELLPDEYPCNMCEKNECLRNEHE